MSDQFYRDLESFSDLARLGDFEGFRSVPDDWLVLAADIVRSREAVAEGRYKDVNLIGAAVISAVLNKLGRDDIPFVFGGDGALLVVPAKHLEPSREALRGVALLARDAAQLDLRIAIIPVADLRARGTDIKLRKFELSPGNYLAMAIGDGLELSEKILKDEQACSPYRLNLEGADLPSLDGLSCRWEPLPSKYGKMVTLILKPKGGHQLNSIIEGMTDAIGFNPLSEGQSAQLVTPENLRFKFLPSGFRREVRLIGPTIGKVGFAVRTVLECVAFVWGYVTGFRVGPFRPKQYLAEISRNTDHRKFDDALRLVLDLTHEQTNALEQYLQNAYSSGLLTYGLKVSKSALMTCFVTDMGNSQHIHFIDGEDGGFSEAATDFHRRLQTQARAKDCLNTG
ncbi:Protein of unknown function (DUF3095) [Roseibium hamelinense]|uniref:DUF3095 family protein n=1 Tax=Roseibium hamelinense TaxID=150831 RepID=A0A562T2Y7_9HYPH|nr:DUF3095 family protein [Roseibium hamelinense]MTI42271.1 DUF3095 family protein [Roseibium hamelinense]TWI87708.1 Protein of unknown function (DUF3095) [Roseibium hamelinense]